MNGWNPVYLVISIIIGILGIWNLARQRNVFLAIAGVFWFLVILFKFFVSNIYNYVLISGVPSVGELALFVVIPVFLFLAFFNTYRR
jgi:hypothetical protein